MPCIWKKTTFSKQQTAVGAFRKWLQGQGGLETGPWKWLYKWSKGAWHEVQQWQKLWQNVAHMRVQIENLDLDWARKTLMTVDGAGRAVLLGFHGFAGPSCQTRTTCSTMWQVSLVWPTRDLATCVLVLHTHTHCCSKTSKIPNRSWLSVLLGLKQISVGMSVGASFDGWRTLQRLLWQHRHGSWVFLPLRAVRELRGHTPKKRAKQPCRCTELPLAFPWVPCKIAPPNAGTDEATTKATIAFHDIAAPDYHKTAATTQATAANLHTHTVPFGAEAPEEHKQAKENVGKRQTAQAHWPAPYLMLYSKGSTMRRAFTKPSFWVSSRSFSGVQVTFWPFGKAWKSVTRDPPNGWGFSCRSLQMSLRCWIPLSYAGNPVFFFLRKWKWFFVDLGLLRIRASKRYKTDIFEKLVYRICSVIVLFIISVKFQPFHALLPSCDLVGFLFICPYCRFIYQCPCFRIRWRWHVSMVQTPLGGSSQWM